MNVNAVTAAASPILVPETVKGIDTPSAGAASFGKFLTDAVRNVQAAQDSAHASAESFMRGETQEIHKVALDQQRAAIALDMFLQVRNKLVSAYQDIMKMQI